MCRYLSFLGLPFNVLTDIVHKAHEYARTFNDVKPFVADERNNNIPTKIKEESEEDLSRFIRSMSEPVPHFISSISSTYDWDHLRSILSIQDEKDDKEKEDFIPSTFEKSYRLFRDNSGGYYFKNKL